MLILFRFRYNFKEVFSVRKLPSTDPGVSLSSFLDCSLNEANLLEEQGQALHKSTTHRVALRRRINARNRGYV